MSLAITGQFSLADSHLCERVRYIGLEMKKGNSAELAGLTIAAAGGNVRMAPLRFSDCITRMYTRHGLDTTTPGSKTINKNTNSTPNKSQTQRARAYKVISFLITDCELSTNPCLRFLYSLGPQTKITLYYAVPCSEYSMLYVSF